MKLRTKMYPRVAGSSIGYLDSGDVDHDAACAHALMQAMTALNGEGWSRKRNPVAEIRDRADSIMAGWGFDSGEVE